MADFREELIKLRLRLLEQKIRSESSRKSTGVYDNSLTSSSSGLQQLLQVETLKSNQLLQKVKVKRQQEENTSNQNHGGDNMKELMTTMMSQNMQLQHLLLQQVVGSHPTENTLHYTRLSTARPLEVEQTGHREMTPFTTLPSSNHAQRAKPPLQVKGPPVPVKRKPSPKPLVARGVATPVRPTERVPEPQMRPRTTRNPEGFLGQIAKNEEQLYPFPGPSKVRKLRHVGYVAWACFILFSLLKKTLQKRLRDIEHLSSLISQAVEELHARHYLDHNGLVYSTLQDAVKDNAFDFKIKSTGVFQRLSQNSQAAFRELSSMIETIVYDVTQIKPSSGLISATRDGVLWHMVQEGAYLPPDYLWQVEKDNMTFTPQGAVAEVTNQVGTMLLLGLFISRGLVSTILLKPTEYGLMEDALSNLGNSNLKVLGSVLMKIVREVSSWKQKKTIPLASELSSQLYSDYEMKFIYKKLDETLIWCKANLKRWTEAYLDSLNRS